MRSRKVYYVFIPVLLGLSAFAQKPGGPGPAPKGRLAPGAAHPQLPPQGSFSSTPPKVATTIPAKGVHLVSAIGAFKIKRGSEAPDYGNLQITFQGTVLVSGLKGTAVAGNGTELEYEQTQYKKKVYFSKGKGTLNVTGQFAGIQFFGQNVNAYYRGDGVIQMFGEFDKNLNTGTYWYDQNPNDKRYWGTSGMTITPSPMSPMGGGAMPQIKIKNVTGKS